MEITVNQFINYFGGGTEVVIEQQDRVHEYLWNGIVDEWVSNPVEHLKNMEVLGSTVIDNKLYIRI